MKRRLLNFLTALSLLLCVSICVLWVRSYWIADTYLRITHLAGTNAAWWTVGCESGAAGVARTTLTMSNPDLQRFLGGLRAQQGRSSGPAVNATWPTDLLPHAGEEQRQLGAATTFHNRYLRLPLWLPALLTSVLPARRLLSASRHRRRSRTNLCVSCGYDLRATPGGCPECGATVSVRHSG